MQPFVLQLTPISPSPMSGPSIDQALAPEPRPLCPDRYYRNSSFHQDLSGYFRYPAKGRSFADVKHLPDLARSPALTLKLVGVHLLILDPIHRVRARPKSGTLRTEIASPVDGRSHAPATIAEELSHDDSLFSSSRPSCNRRSRLPCNRTPGSNDNP